MPDGDVLGAQVFTPETDTIEDEDSDFFGGGVAVEPGPAESVEVQPGSSVVNPIDQDSMKQSATDAAVVGAGSNSDDTKADLSGFEKAVENFVNQEDTFDAVKDELFKLYDSGQYNPTELADSCVAILFDNLELENFAQAAGDTVFQLAELISNDDESGSQQDVEGYMIEALADLGVSGEDMVGIEEQIIGDEQTYLDAEPKYSEIDGYTFTADDVWMADGDTATSDDFNNIIDLVDQDTSAPDYFDPVDTDFDQAFNDDTTTDIDTGDESSSDLVERGEEDQNLPEAQVDHNDSQTAVDDETSDKPTDTEKQVGIDNDDTFRLNEPDYGDSFDALDQASEAAARDTLTELQQQMKSQDNDQEPDDVEKGLTNTYDDDSYEPDPLGYY